MTEIRIYEDHNKVVICAETKSMYDKLFSVIDEPDCVQEWSDEDYTYLRMPLDKFMSFIRKLISE